MVLDGFCSRLFETWAALITCLSGSNIDTALIFVPILIPCNDMLLFAAVLQVAKVRSELDIVMRNVSVLNEMIEQLVPGEEATADYELFTVSKLYCPGQKLCKGNWMLYFTSSGQATLCS